MNSTGEPVNIDVIIDRFNVIRGGKSFNEPGVYGELSNLFNSLPDNEKVALENFVRKMGEIVTGPEHPQQNAVNNPVPQTAPPPQTNQAPQNAGTAPGPAAAAPAAAV